MRGKVLEIMKWGLILLLAFTVFYCINTRRKYVPPNNGTPVLEKIDVQKEKR